MDYPKILGKLCALPGPSGFEYPAAECAVQLLRPLVDEAAIDPMNSVVGVRRCGREKAPKLLLDAHLDEVGYIVTGHKNGFLSLASLGGTDARVLPDQELTLLAEPPVLGVVSCLPPHVQSREQMNRAVPLSELCVDVGMSQEEALRKIPVGTPAVYRCGCVTLA